MTYAFEIPFKANRIPSTLKNSALVLAVCFDLDEYKFPQDPVTQSCARALLLEVNRTVNNSELTVSIEKQNAMPSDFPEVRHFGPGPYMSASWMSTHGKDEIDLIVEKFCVYSSNEAISEEAWRICGDNWVATFLVRAQKPFTWFNRSLKRDFYLSTQDTYHDGSEEYSKRKFSRCIPCMTVFNVTGNIDNFINHMTMLTLY